MKYLLESINTIQASGFLQLLQPDNDLKEPVCCILGPDSKHQDRHETQAQVICPILQPMLHHSLYLEDFPWSLFMAIFL